MRRTALLLASMALALWLACGAMFALEQPALAAFPGQNGLISFEAHSANGSNDIFVVRPDGTGIRNLTETLESEEWEPTWSPDGTQVAFVRGGFEQGAYRTGLYVMNADGSGQRLLSSTSPSDIDWSPDSTKLAFSGFYGDVYVVDAGGTDQTRIASGWDVAWSPEGGKIAFTCGAGQWDICVWHANGTPIVNLTNGDDNNYKSDMYPAWSPDGTKIAFQTSGRDTGGFWEIYTMNADGSGQTGLATRLVAERVAWSPDGTRFAYGSQEIGTADTNGSNQAFVAYGRNPDWQPNTAPKVVPLSPKPGATTKDRTPRISAEATDVQDDLTELDTTLSLDGKTISSSAFVYDPATNKLAYTPSRNLSYGKHSVQVVATDSAKAATAKTWSFRVIRR